MSHFTRRYFVAGMLATLITIPLQRAQACLHAGLHSHITFDDVPDNLPSGLVAKHFHLTNRVPEFENWRKPLEISFKDKNVKMGYFSFIGMGTSINPWTHWLTSRLPDWLVSKPAYIPIFAPISSCTERFAPFGDKIDRELILVGKTLTQTNGEPAFAAASYRESDERWETYSGHVTSS